MASFDLGAKAYLAERSAVRSEPLLRAYLALLAELGYYMIDRHREAQRISELLRAMDPGEPHLTPGLSPRLDTAVREFAAGTLPIPDFYDKYGPYDPSEDPNDNEDPEALEVGIFLTRVDPEVGHVSFGLTCAPSKGWIKLHSDSRKFDNDPTHPRWMHLTQALYDTWGPLYLSPHYNSGEPKHSRAEIEAGNIHLLYRDYNYLGPALVARLGHERLLHTPGVRITELNDGGIFLGRGDTTRAAAYLGWRISI